jgi:hypothetical protein
MRFYEEQRLIVFYRCRVIYKHLHHFAAHFGLYLVEELHGLNDADHITFFHLITYTYKRWLFLVKTNGRMSRSWENESPRSCQQELLLP